jgi:hypothetical protein
VLGTRGIDQRANAERTITGGGWLKVPPRDGRPQAASVLQAAGFRSCVTVFRLNAAVVVPIWLKDCISAEYGGTRVHNRGGS